MGFAGGGDVIARVERLLVPEGTDEDQRAGVNAGHPLQQPTENVQRQKNDALVLHIAAGELLEKTLHVHRLASNKESEREGGQTRKDMTLEVNQSKNDAPNVGRVF